MAESESVPVSGLPKTVTFAYGALIPANPECPKIDLTKDVYVFGRSTDLCDYVFPAVHVSNRHFRIVREVTMRPDGTEDVIVFVHDLSTYGTLVNGKVVGKNKRQRLENGDQIQFLTTKKVATDYVFQLLERKRTPEPIDYDSGVRRIEMYYDLGRQLGSGHFASVKLATNKETGQKFAVKVIDKTMHSNNPKFFEALGRELQILMKIQHPNVVQICDYFDESNILYIVLELVEGGELFDVIVKKNKLTELESKIVFQQMLDGVEYLHNNGIAHRDLKPENLLVTSEDILTMTVKLTDFGLARIVGENSFMKTICGTPLYCAPEVTEAGSGYSKAVDLWSLGVILYICLCGYPPFNDQLKKPSLAEQTKRGIYSFPSKYWGTVDKSAIELIKGLIQPNPKKRFTLEQTKNHRWLKDDIVFRSMYERFQKSQNWRPFVSPLLREDSSSTAGAEPMDISVSTSMTTETTTTTTTAAVAAVGFADNADQQEAGRRPRRKQTGFARDMPREESSELQPADSESEQGDGSPAGIVSRRSKRARATS